MLEWVVMPSSRGSSLTQGFEAVPPEAPALQADSLLLSHQGNPIELEREETKVKRQNREGEVVRK